MGNLKWLGEIGVDTGSLIIMDPCYLESLKLDGLKPSTYYLDAASGKKFYCKVHGSSEPDAVSFQRFDTPLKDGETPNEKIRSGKWVPRNDRISEFSLSGIYNQINKFGWGVIQKLGAGSLFATSTFFGDGTARIYAEIDRKSKRPKRLVIDLP